MTKSLPWRGHGRTLKNPAVFTADDNYIAGERIIPKGSTLRQFETTDAGFTAWIEPNGDRHFYRD